MAIGSKITPEAVSFQEVDDRSEGQRLDNFLLKHLRQVPRSKIYRIIRKGEVRVNKGRCKPDTRLCIGDIVRIPPIVVPAKNSPPVRVPDRLVGLLEDAVLFEDDGLLVINKPHGIAVHGGSGISHGVIEILRQSRSESRFLELVHRLDRDTSGVLMIAKKRKVLVELHNMLQTGGVIKNYYAWVSGKWPANKPSVTAPLRKNVLKSGERIVIVATDGKPSETSFEVMSFLKADEPSGNTAFVGGFTLIKASPLTGRTHQIRVHCQFAGHPVLGDDKYCPPEINQACNTAGLKRMCLHAESVVLKWRDGKLQHICAGWDLSQSPFA